MTPTAGRPAAPWRPIRDSLSRPEAVRIATARRTIAAPFPRESAPMSLSFHAASVPVFRQLLVAMGDVLAKGAVHAEERKIEPDALLQSRLFPDMFPLLRQVQIAADFAKSVSARLAGVDVPAYADDEKTFDDLQARIAKTIGFIDGLEASAFADAGAREIVLRPGTPKEKRLDAQTYLLHYGLPQFLFHVTTTYALLRHGGVAVGKKDFMCAY